MSNARPLSYSAATKGSSNITCKTHSTTETEAITHPNYSRPISTQGRPLNYSRPISRQEQNTRRSPSPSQRPQTQTDEEPLYVLTLFTDEQLATRMTALRTQYFPKKINKLDAHLTLFHALPESKLESSIIPLVKDVAAKTSPFAIKADKPFRMKKGFAVSVSGRIGGPQAKRVHHDLQREWKAEGFLSDQDAGDCRLHYTLMNKVDDENEVSGAYNKMLDSWRGETGTAEGLALWRYDRGFWIWNRNFNFGEYL